MKALVLDFLVFGNAYLEARRNRLGQVIRLIRTPAKYMRRGEQAGRYWFVKSWMEEHEFAPDSVFHLMNPDIHQEIYGLPEYLAGLVSASLSQVATLFRTRFFENGSHAGVLVHLTDAGRSGRGQKTGAGPEQCPWQRGLQECVCAYGSGSKDGIQIKTF
ncbi:hypothetical protein [Sodalis glossinidius]|nr:hypothetical protein [Sodalis glossinidius]